MRVSKAMIMARVQYLAKITKKPLVLDQAYGGYRLGMIVNKSGGQTDLSPRLKGGEFYTWLNAFRDGYEFRGRK